MRSAEYARIRGVMGLMVTEVGLIHLDWRCELARSCQGEFSRWEMNEGVNVTGDSP
jgi:hypothetical protein